MAFKFRDLIVTIVPRGADGSGGCGACSDAGSATVGSCTSECGVACLDSGEAMEVMPWSLIDPPAALELRQLLIYGLTMSGAKLPVQARREVVEEQMRPHTVEELHGLERRLKRSLEELEDLKRTLK